MTLFGFQPVEKLSLEASVLGMAPALLQNAFQFIAVVMSGHGLLSLRVSSHMSSAVELQVL